MNTQELFKKVRKIEINRCNTAVLKTFVVGCLLMSSLFSYGQESNFSIEANFPYTFGDNFVDEGYNGAADVGLKYRFAEYSAVDLGASLNVGAFFRDDTRFDGSSDINRNAIIFQPRIFASYHIDGYPQLHPMVGLGYSIFAFNVNDENFAGADFQENSSDDGFNLNVAVAYDVAEKWFLQLQYDFIKLSARNVRKTPYNQNVNILKIGIGYRF